METPESWADPNIREDPGGGGKLQSKLGRHLSGRKKGPRSNAPMRKPPQPPFTGGGSSKPILTPQGGGAHGKLRMAQNTAAQNLNTPGSGPLTKGTPYE